MPKVDPRNIAYVSLRDFEEEEAFLIRKHNIKSYNTCSLINFGTENVVNQLLNQLSGCTDIYVSFDVDCLDASISKGTGLPVKGGIMPWEAELLTGLLLQSPKIAGFELTELNPLLDTDNQTTTLAYRILEKGIESIKNQHHSRHRKMLTE